MKEKNDINKGSADIEGGPLKEAEVKLEDSKVDPISDQNLEDREKKVAAREALVESKLKEIDETQELFRKEWDDKIAEIDALKELHDTSDSDLEDVDYGESEDEEEEEESGSKALEEGKDLDTGFENVLLKEIKEERDFRNKIIQRQTRIEEEIAERNLREEIDKASESYPKMDKREILIEIQRDPSQKIEDLAKKSEEDYLAREAKIREELKADFEKEKSGFQEEVKKTETVPSAPVSESTPSRQVRSKDRWTQAAKEARGDMAEGE
jgi:hypothetical protein